MPRPSGAFTPRRHRLEQPHPPRRPPPAALRLERRGPRGHRHAQPAGAQEPAHLRLLPRADATPSTACGTSRRCKAVVLTGAGENFCSGGDVHEIIGPLVEMREERRMDRPARVHAPDRRPGEDDARLPAADRRGDRRHLRRRRRDPRHGLATCGSARRAARSPSSSPASASPAPTWAPAPSCRASSARGAPPSCSTPAASWTAEEAERWGFYNRLVRAGDAAGRGAGRSRTRIAHGPDLRARHDQAPAAPGVGHGRRRGDRGRGAGAGDLHADRGLRPRLPRLRGEGKARRSRAN